MSEFLLQCACESPVPADWREQLVAMLGERPRRIGPWAELALFGALRCMAEAGEASLPEPAALILTSRYGTHQATRATLAQMADDLPMPLSFLQTQPSQVLALLAQRLGWHGQGMFLAAATLDEACALAAALAPAGGALVGWVEDQPLETSVWRRLRPAL